MISLQEVSNSGRIFLDKHFGMAREMVWIRSRDIRLGRVHLSK